MSTRGEVNARLDDLIASWGDRPGDMDDAYEAGQRTGWLEGWNEHGRVHECYNSPEDHSGQQRRKRREDVNRQLDEQIRRLSR